ncbi:hypothetical protein ACFL5O_10805 [Myxococcota bacterium]
MLSGGVQAARPSVAPPSEPSSYGTKGREIPVALPSLPPAAASQHELGVSVRERWRFSVGGEIGWNSLAGLGVNLSYHLIPHLAADLGAGVGMGGTKGGLRLRVNLLKSKWTPLFGVGVLYSIGSGGEDVETKVNKESVTLRILGTPYIQSVVGVNYTGQSRFVSTVTAGYAFRLRDNVRFVSGSRDAFDTIRPFFGSGLVVAASLGYAF